MSDIKPPAGTVRVLHWQPKGEPTLVRTMHLVPFPAKHAELLLLRLKLELLGEGCQCRSPEEIVGILKILGCEVEIQGGTPSGQN